MPNVLTKSDLFFNFFTRQSEQYQQFVSNDKIKQINGFRQKSFFHKRNGVFSEIKELIDITSSSSQLHVSENIVILDSLRQVLPTLSASCSIITDRVPFDFICSHYQVPNPLTPVLYIEDIETGDSLREIIGNLKHQKPACLLAIGGGRTFDFAKYISLQTAIPLLAIPTSLATHVYASSKIDALPPIRELGHDLTIDGDPAHLSLIDTTILTELYSTNSRLILSGFGDIMAFINARKDWCESPDGELNHNAFVDQCIDTIIETLVIIDLSKPLSHWISDYVFIQCLLCHITDWVGSAPASGAEHLFAKCLEGNLHPIPLHGEMVALGVYIYQYARGDDITFVRKLLDKFSISISFNQIGVTESCVVNALEGAHDEGLRKGRNTLLDQPKFKGFDWSNLIQEMIAKELLLL